MLVKLNEGRTTLSFINEEIIMYFYCMIHSVWFYEVKKFRSKIDIIYFIEILLKRIIEVRFKV